MKTRLKRALSLALTALMLLILVPGALASEIVTSDPVIPGLALENVAESEKSAADKLFDRLMGCATYDDFAAIMDALTEEEITLLDAFTDEQNAALEVKVAELGGYAVATLEDREYTIAQGGSQTIYISRMRNSNFSFSCEPTADITTSLNYGNGGYVSGYTISVGSSVPTGTYTLTVNYETTSGFGPNQKITENTDTITIYVLAEGEQPAKVFYLKTPTSDPDSNDTGEWGRDIGNGRVNTNGATWSKDSTGADKNIFNPASYVKGMPTGMVYQTDGSWLLPKDTYAQDYTAIYTAYKAKLANDLGISADEFSKEDIETIYLTPYKISTNADGMHIDCTVSVKTKKFFAAKFWVTLPDGSVVEQVDAKNYRTGNAIEKTSAAPDDAAGKYPSTKVVDGITYRFDGWYNEAGNKIAEDGWDYTPNETELADGTVNFYAHYVKAEATLTIKKTLSGNMYDANKAFTFTVTADKDMTYGGETNASFTFNLKKNEKVTISVPVDATVTVSEDPSGYTYSLGAETTITDHTDLVEGTGIRFTMPDADSIVVFNNDKTAIPDTGVLLDSLPYILILAVVVAIGVIVFIRKRRNRDDD